MSQMPDTAQCLRCGYLLRGLTRNRCPECGQEFTPEDPSTYRSVHARHKRWRFLTLAIGVILVFLGLLWLPVWLPTVWPPDWLSRHAQRQKVAERLQAVGGVDALKQDCLLVMQTHPEDGLYWHGAPGSPALPPALAALQPVAIYIANEPNAAIVRIKLFGMHSTGGHSRPYFGFEVVSGAGADAYRPQPSDGGVSGNYYTTYRRVAENVYEIY
jgi:hypothetical protein